MISIVAGVDNFIFSVRLAVPVDETAILRCVSSEAEGTDDVFSNV